MNNYGRTAAVFTTILVAVCYLGGCSSVITRSVSAPAFPQPVSDQPGEHGKEYQQRRREWIEQMHRTAPDVDWRVQDARSRAKDFTKRENLRRLRIANGASATELRAVETTGIKGLWVERGSNNQAGRVTGAVFDAGNDRLSVLAAGGQLWRASRTLLDWTSPNDAAVFLPSTSTGFMLRLDGIFGERLLIASKNPSKVYRSDDGGLTWAENGGLEFGNPLATLGLVSRDLTQTEVYLLRVHYDFDAAAWRPHLFSSADRGASFISQGFIGGCSPRCLVSIFSPNYDSSNVYILSGNELSSIAPTTHALTAISTIPLGFTLTGDETVVLRGGVDNGEVFLYAFYSQPSTGTTATFVSTDGGLSWAERAAVPGGLMSNNSAATSTNDPLRAYAGNLNAYSTADGGFNWTLVNDWGEYYALPTNKLHADIPNIDVWRDSEGTDIVYISTDGGLFESTDNMATVQNLSLSGMNISQYYGSYTRRRPPFEIFVGSQDQGYQKASSTTNGIESYKQIISGDYSHLDSTDNGEQLWMVYPSFVLLDTATYASNLVSWDIGENFLWMAPLAVNPLDPSNAWVGGGNISGSGSRIISLTHSAGQIASYELAFDFGATVTAVAFSNDGRTRYAINDNSVFFRQSSKAPFPWLSVSNGLPDNHFFFGNRILPDSQLAGKIYVAGAGYSNPGVFVSIDDGDSFIPMSTGLPNTMVFDLAQSGDGEHLFAATELGPYYFDTATQSWLNIAGLAAPSQVYWDVDFVDEQNTARFSTYGRGIWDFRLPEDDIFRDGFEAEDWTLRALDDMATGEYIISADGHSFPAFVENINGTGWLLVGRGREGWEFDTDGPASDPTLVKDHIGTSAAFSPTAFSDAIINDLITQAGVDLTDVEIRLKRAASVDGSAYQEDRWRPIKQATWTWEFDDAGGYEVAHEIVSTPFPQGTLAPHLTTTQDTGGSFGHRIFTWAWVSHLDQQGFSYGISLGGVNNNDPSTFLWEAGTEDHAIPYTEVYIRIK
jgi:hypothetical protein